MVELLSKPKVIGVKQVTKAIKDNSASVVIIAKDADKNVTVPIINMCRKEDINILFADSMQKLGNQCKIDVGAACVAILSEKND